MLILGGQSIGYRQSRWLIAIAVVLPFLEIGGPALEEMVSGIE
jgi:hypothetical protein